MKQLLKRTCWFIALPVILLAGCQQDETLLLLGVNNLETKSEKLAAVGENYLYSGGVFVLSEGNMRNENGTLSFINASNTTLADYPAINWVFGDPSTGAMGNVSQDLFIANNKIYIVAQNGNYINPGGTKHLLELNNTLGDSMTFNPNNYFPTGWSGHTPTHLAVTGNKIYVRTNDGVVITDTAYFLDPDSAPSPTSIDGIAHPSRTRMAMVNNGGTKYLYVGSENGIVYRINTRTDAVDNIPVQGTIAGLVAVRRDNKRDQYIYALGIVSENLAILSRISGTTVVATDSIKTFFDPGLLIPSVGLCCYAGGAQDTLYFRSNGWNPTQIFRYGKGAGATGSLDTLYTVPDSIDPLALIIYGDLGVDQTTGDVYFGYVGDWGDYATINGIGRLRRGNPNSIQDYEATSTVPGGRIDTRFTAGIYFYDEFDM